MSVFPPNIKSLPEWAQDRLRWLEQREDNLRAENSALRGEVATLRGARSAEDVREMLCEASCVDVTDARCARIWSLLEHPATTMTTLAVIADERGESYAKARAELAALQSRLAAAEAEAERAAELLVEASGWMKAECYSLHHRRNQYHASDEACPVEALQSELLARIDALLAPKSQGPAGGEVVP